MITNSTHEYDVAVDHIVLIESEIHMHVKLSNIA